MVVADTRRPVAPEKIGVTHVADIVGVGPVVLIEAVQDSLAGDTLDLIFVFNTTETDNDGVSDYLVFDNVSLILNYTP